MIQSLCETCWQVTDQLGVSKERARQIEQRAIAKMRSMAADLHVKELL